MKKKNKSGPKSGPRSGPKSGQGMVEYIILVAIIAVASLAIVKVLGNTVSRKIAQITFSLQGKHREADNVGDAEVRREHYQKRGLDDFYESPE
jgi:Flp pilus assembly pilin Flp